MSLKKRLKKRIERQERTYETEQLMKRKRSEEYEALEEVFDRPTLMAIYDLMNKGEIGEIHGVVSAGKEARVYWGRTESGEELAIKIFLTLSAEFRKGMLPYLIGDPRFKRIRRNPRSLVYTWAQKEYKNLLMAYQAKVRVPKPILVQKNVLLMEFIGKYGTSAPLLKDIELPNPAGTYYKIMLYAKRLFRTAGLVHGDLSEYNIMIWKRNPVVFDVSQAVSMKHPNSSQFLIRDLQNINRYFKKLGVGVMELEEAYKCVTGDKIVR